MQVISSFVSQLKLLSSNHGMQPFKIKGKTLKNGTVIQSIVRCYDKASGVLLLQTTSDNEGKYSFSGLSKHSKYCVVSHDPASQFNAVIQDNVVPK